MSTARALQLPAASSPRPILAWVLKVQLGLLGMTVQKFRFRMGRRVCVQCPVPMLTGAHVCGTDADLAAALVVNRAYQRVADAVWDMVFFL